MDMYTLIHDEVERRSAELANLEVGTEEYKAAVDGLTKLVDRAMELEKLDIESRESKDKHKRDRNERIDRWIQSGIQIAGIVVPCCVTIWGTNKILKFEIDGTVTSIIGRGFVNKLLPKK